MHALKRYTPSIAVLVWMLAIFIESAQPGDPLDTLPFPHFDKLEHFGAYSVLGLLVAWALSHNWGFKPGLKLFWVSLAIGSLYGATDEVHQLFVVFRHCDALDWLADTLGTAAGACLLCCWKLHAPHE